MSHCKRKFEKYAYRKEESGLGGKVARHPDFEDFTYLSSMER